MTRMRTWPCFDSPAYYRGSEKEYAGQKFGQDLS
jgi:hypothetical protein